MGEGGMKMTYEDNQDTAGGGAPPEDEPLTMRVIGSFPCAMGYRAEASISRPVDLARLRPFARAIAWYVDLDEGNGVLAADHVTFRVDGSITSMANVERDATARIGEAFQLVARAEQCTGCGLCAERCPTGALYMKGGRVEVLEDECVFCKDCFGECPGVRLEPGSGDSA